MLIHKSFLFVIFFQPSKLLNTYIEVCFLSLLLLQNFKTGNVWEDIDSSDIEQNLLQWWKYCMICAVQYGTYKHSKYA